MRGILTITETAQRLGITHSLVARYVRHRRLRAILIGSRPVIRTAEVERFIREREERRNGKGRNGQACDGRIKPLPSRGK